jgi:hypothetical protein
MPSVRRVGEKIFKENFYEAEYQEQPELLSTIRVPKNLLYLTDRLPKPIYDSTERRSGKGRQAEIDELKRRTHDNQDLPNLRH